jgi:hypothetical protein
LFHHSNCERSELSSTLKQVYKNDVIKKQTMGLK